MWVGWLSRRGSPGLAVTGLATPGTPRVGVEGKDQRQQQKEQEFCLCLRQVRRISISIRWGFLFGIALMYLVVY